MRFSPGDKVQLISDPNRLGIIERPSVVHAGMQYYEVFWGGGIGTNVAGEIDLISHAPAASPSASLVSGILGGYAEFQRLITLQRLRRDEPLRNNVYAFNASRTRFYPYQFKPLLKFLDSPRNRLLICDEVGLGKTIEAGLILAELRARQTIRSVLIVCPSNLMHKWRLELKRRFGEEFSILTSSALQEKLEEYDESSERFRLDAIVSLESLRNQQVLERLEAVAPGFDLIVMDEAHHMRNPTTNQRKVGEILGRTAAAMIMLTATPIHLGSENLFSLLNILDEEDFPDLQSAQERFRQNETIVRAQSILGRIPFDAAALLETLQEAAGSSWFVSQPALEIVLERTRKILNAAQPQDRRDILELQRDVAELNLLGRILTRSRKRDVQEDVALRKPSAILVDLEPAERSFYEAVTDLIRAENAARKEESIVGQWRLNMPQRRMASSIPAMVAYYRANLKDAGDFSEEGDDVEEDLGVTPEGDEAPAVRVARARLERIIATWHAGRADSKYEKLRELIRTLSVENPDAKMLVFATFRGTLDYLRQRLTEDDVRTLTIHGGVPVDERPGLIQRFQDDPTSSVMLSSRVGSEGLDFQFCDTMVNYDLPWNPMEVEQRIGRLDRIGQRSPTIRIFNFWVRNTIEERILQRLYERIGIFEQSIGDLEAILGDVAVRIEREILSKQLTPEQEIEAAERIARVIDSRKAAIEGLESKAAQFLGVDAYFDQEVAAIRQKRRYITGQQLRRFLADFLAHEAPRTRLEYSTERKVGLLVPDERLRAFIRGSGHAGDLVSLLGSGDQGLALTFDSEVAFESSRIEFINVLHPLVTAVVEHFDRDRLAKRAQHVVLRSEWLEPGVYFLFVYRLHVQAARGGDLLECVVLREDLASACDSEQAEALLGEVVERGEEPEGGALGVEVDLATRAIQEAERLFLQRREALRAELTVSNNAFINQRIASMNASYNKNIRRQTDLLERARSRARQDRYLRMLRGTIARLESELEEKRRDLEEQRTLALEHKEIAAVVLEILPLPDM